MKWLKFSDEPLLYRKEILRTGSFMDSGGQKVDITKAMLSHVKSNVDEFIANKIRIPLFKTHNEDPDNERGLVVGAEMDGDSLYAHVKFADEDAKKQGLRNDVSVCIPSNFRDGKGRSYHMPLRHLALTSYPVVPGLNGFDVLAASLTDDLKESREEAKQTEADDLADAASTGGDGEGKKGESLIKAISAIVGVTGSDDLLKEIQKLKKHADSTTLDNEDVMTAQQFQFSGTAVKAITEARKTILLSLVENSNISPNVRDQLEELFCDEECIKFDLSAEKDVMFDRIVEILRGNKPIEFSAKGNDVSHEQSEKPSNTLVEDARRRAGLQSVN